MLLQAEAARQLAGDATAFECILSGSRMMKHGDIIRLSVRPSLIGRIEYFAVAGVSLLALLTHGGSQIYWKEAILLHDATALPI